MNFVDTRVCVSAILSACELKRLWCLVKPSTRRLEGVLVWSVDGSSWKNLFIEPRPSAIQAFESLAKHKKLNRSPGYSVYFRQQKDSFLWNIYILVCRGWWWWKLSLFFFFLNTHRRCKFTVRFNTWQNYRAGLGKKSEHNSEPSQRWSHLTEKNGVEEFGRYCQTCLIRLLWLWSLIKQDSSSEWRQEQIKVSLGNVAVWMTNHLTISQGGHLTRWKWNGKMQKEKREKKEDMEATGVWMFSLCLRPPASSHRLKHSCKVNRKR